MSAAPPHNRIDKPGFGRFIDRSRPLTFTFDGRLHNGFAGDVIASALAAEGRKVLSRSFKYHRPRGALTMAGHDANCLVQIADDPHVRADRHRLTPGVAVRSLNWLGSLDRDWLAGIQAFSRFLPVGFYYKTFFRPVGAWKLFEPAIRRFAGLGRLEPRAQPRRYDKTHLFTDVLVIGGGPAGLEVAIAASEAGADTLLIDEWPKLGGSLLFGRDGADSGVNEARLSELTARAKSQPSLTMLTDTTVSGLFSDHWAAAISGNRLLKIRAKATVVAAGTFDQPLVFRNNDRPGIMFADAAQRLMRFYGVVNGARAVVATSNHLGYEAALDLDDAGVTVAAIVDLRAAPGGPMVEAARARSIPIIDGSTLVDARGHSHVEAVAVTRISDNGLSSGEAQWILADLVAMNVGYAPALNLASHAGARVNYDPQIHMHRAYDTPPGLFVTGSAAGLWSHDRVTAHAREIGAQAARHTHGETIGAPPSIEDALTATITHPFPIFAHEHGMDFVDFDEDLQVKDIIETVHEGYDDIQLVKRYSTAGLGPSQGRHTNLNVIRLVAKATGKAIADIGTTTFRPPLVPEKFGILAGRASEPIRLTPMHDRHGASGAEMMVSGLWMRPAYYGPPEVAAQHIRAEVLAVRNGVGIIDVSTLGGFEIRGTGAAAFLERMYTWRYAKLPVGRARYALMCDQAGVIIDDGVAARLGEHHFYVTATTGAADQVYRQMGWFNAQWRMDVDIANVTAAYAAINLAGPKARDLIESLQSDIDFSPASFPYMAARTGNIGGVAVRVLRVGFVGELGFEIHCPAGCGEALWDALVAAGTPHGLKPFGVEAQRVLRLEKGHIIVGQDTDGLTHPAEAGLDWALANDKPLYVGQRSIAMQVAKGVARKLVGFTLVDSSSSCPKECHLVIHEGDIAGRVTSAVRSPTLGHVIGLAYVPVQLAATGSRFTIRIDGGCDVSAVVAPTPFYDPQNARQEL